MHGALHVATTGMTAQDTNLKVFSNNLANVSTVGFKKDRAVFEDLLYQVRRQPGAESGADSQLPSGLQIGSGGRTVSTQKMFSEGDFQITDKIVTQSSDREFHCLTITVFYHSENQNSQRAS